MVEDDGPERHATFKDNGVRQNTSFPVTAATTPENVTTDIADFRVTLFSRIEAQADDIRSDLAQVPADIHSRSRYHIVERLASGGLGDVYKAYDRKLRRTVALKVSKQRSHGRGSDVFLREYRVTARLQHPGVPAVYSVGRLRNGRRFYAMRLVCGQTLSELVAKRGPTDSYQIGTTSNQGLRSLLQVFYAVCDTVDAAHHAGIVHLDLKPDNIVVEPHGATFVVDWGLARRFLARHETADDRGNRSSIETLCKAAPIAGTLEFMAPEQLQGLESQIGPATDVFALGGILHFVLTSSPPRIRPQEISRTRFFSFIRRGPVAGPAAHALTPQIVDIPPELKSICQKALAPAGTDRYRSPRELREDLERWERRFEVSAHRGKYRIPELAARFAARHARVLALSASALTALTGALALAGWQQAKASRLQIATAEATADRRIASQVALTALEQQVAGVQRQEILRRPELLPLRLQMLQAAWNQYEQWAVASLDDRELKFRLVKQLHDIVATIDETVSELALLDNQLNSGLARTVATRSLEVSRELVASAAADPEADRLLATSLQINARHLTNTGDTSTAEALIQEATAILRGIVNASAHDRSAVRDLIRTERMLASFRFQAAMAAHSVPERRTLLQKAAHTTAETDRLTALLDLTDTSHAIELASLENQRGIVTHKLGNVESAVHHYQQALTILERHPAADPADGAIDDFWLERSKLHARILNNYGLTLRGLNRSREALAAHQDALHIRSAILQHYPWMLSVRSDLAQSLGNIADTTVDFADTDAELRSRRQAVGLLRQTIEDYPSMRGAKEFWGLHRIRIVAALHRQGKDAEAAQEFRETIELCPQPELAEPTNGGHLLDVVLGHCLNATNGSQDQDAMHAATQLLIRCHQLGQLASPPNRMRFLSDPAFEELRKVPHIRDIVAYIRNL